MSDSVTARLGALLAVEVADGAGAAGPAAPGGPPGPPAFALLHRPHSAGHGRVEILTGDLAPVPGLDALPLPAGPGPAARDRHELLVLVPFRQIAERGFDHRDDGTPLLAMSVREQASASVEQTLEALPDRPFGLAEAGFDLDDAAYGDIVRRIMTEEIGHGEGANFVIKRSFTATVQGPPTRAALTVFRRLLARETGAYWTFLIHTGERTLVGATPERHVGLNGGALTMTPISGTYRYPATGPTVPGALGFLADPKERDELYMVVDEELKMMARICAPGVRVHGPYLREMTRLAHTEYHLSGRSSREVGEILRETMFVPTVTGSPLENACRVIKRYEPDGRGYYSGVLALIGRDAAGARRMDSSVLIRTADIGAGGRLRVSVGATLVRNSGPDAEAAETRAKSAALLEAVRAPVRPLPSIGAPAPAIAEHPEVRRALRRRNHTLAPYWLHSPNAGSGQYQRPALTGRSVLVVDGEDTFTAMLGHQLGALGLVVTVRRYDEPFAPGGFDLVLVGPGPGDPREENHPKIAALRAAVRQLLQSRRPFAAVCLGHQVLGSVLGLELIRKNPPHQGLQRTIDHFGRPATVGFYNTFAARCDTDRFPSPYAPEGIDVSRDPDTGEVHALRGARLCSLQFHPESLLSQDGLAVLGDELTTLMAVPAATGE